MDFFGKGLDGSCFVSSDLMFFSNALVIFLFIIPVYLAVFMYILIFLAQLMPWLSAVLHGHS